MFEVSIALLSNRCGSSCGRRRRRKLAYYGTDLSGFVAELNSFVLDEQHRFAIEYRFAVLCSRNKVDVGGQNATPRPPLVPLTWTELDCLMRQFVNLPVLAQSAQRRERIQRTGSTFYEQARVLVLDDEEENVLLTTLFKLQQDAQLDGAESSERVDSYEWLCASALDAKREPVSVVGVRGKMSAANEPVWNNGEESRPVTAPSCFTSASTLLTTDLSSSLSSLRDTATAAATAGSNTMSAYSRCREKIDELQQLQEIMDESAPRSGPSASS